MAISEDNAVLPGNGFRAFDVFAVERLRGH